MRGWRLPSPAPESCRGLFFVDGRKPARLDALADVFGCGFYRGSQCVIIHSPHEYAFNRRGLVFDGVGLGLGALGDLAESALVQPPQLFATSWSLRVVHISIPAPARGATANLNKSVLRNLCEQANSKDACLLFYDM